jgi:tetratricopeptide (TPR) repeat protein
MQMEQYQEAKGYFETVVSLDENDDMAHGALANVLNKLGKQKEAQEHHKKALALDSTYPAHHFNYANTLYDLGRHSEALVAYQKALELDPSLEVAKQMITQLGGEHGAK